MYGHILDAPPLAFLAFLRCGPTNLLVLQANKIEITIVCCRANICSNETITLIRQNFQFQQVTITLINFELYLVSHLTENITK